MNSISIDQYISRHSRINIYWNIGLKKHTTLKWTKLLKQPNKTPIFVSECHFFKGADLTTEISHIIITYGSIRTCRHVPRKTPKQITPVMFPRHIASTGARAKCPPSIRAAGFPKKAPGSRVSDGRGSAAFSATVSRHLGSQSESSIHGAPQYITTPWILSTVLRRDIDQFRDYVVIWKNPVTRTRPRRLPGRLCTIAG